MTFSVIVARRKREKCGGGGVYGEYLALPSNKPITLADPRMGNKNASAGSISFILTQLLTKNLPNYRLVP